MVVASAPTRIEGESGATRRDVDDDPSRDAALEAGEWLQGGRTALGDSGDDTGSSGVSRSAIHSTLVRLGFLAAALVLVYGRELAQLPRALTADSPLAYAALAPVLALVLGVLGIREARSGRPALPVRAGDAICGGTMLVIALLAGWGGPHLFGFAATPWRVSMASMPFFVAGSIWLLFGGRAAWWLRHAILFSALAAPVWYVWLITPMLSASTTATWFAVAPLARLFGAQTAEAAGTGLVAIGDQLAAVSSVCSGASSMVAWLIVGGALATRLDGTFRRKARWLLIGTLLAWVLNVVRILVVVALGHYVSGAVAMEWVHPWAGLVAVLITCGLMLRSAGRLGLRTRTPLGAPVLPRLAAVAPPRWGRAAAAVALVAAILAGVSVATAWRLDALGGQNGTRNRPVADVLADVPALAVGDRSWTNVEYGAVPWAAQYFGAGADWQRFGLFAPTEGDRPSWTVSVDTTAVSDAANLDLYALEACYGFHGYLLQRSEVSDVLPDRTAERIDYRDDGSGVHTVVLSWRQKLGEDRIERVVVSARARVVLGRDEGIGPREAAAVVDDAPGAEGLPSVTEAETAVIAAARVLAAESSTTEIQG
jgi:exosortase/archaeosortase family protein